MLVVLTGEEAASHSVAGPEETTTAEVDQTPPYRRQLRPAPTKAGRWPAAAQEATQGSTSAAPGVRRVPACDRQMPEDQSDSRGVTTTEAVGEKQPHRQVESSERPRSDHHQREHQARQASCTSVERSPVHSPAVQNKFPQRGHLHRMIFPHAAAPIALQRPSLQADSACKWTEEAIFQRHHGCREISSNASWYLEVAARLPSQRQKAECWATGGLACTCPWTQPVTDDGRCASERRPVSEGGCTSLYAAWPLRRRDGAPSRLVGDEPADLCIWGYHGNRRAWKDRPVKIENGRR